MIKSIKEFYANFLTAMYGFLLIRGFEDFINIISKSDKPTVFILLTAAYVNVLHFWLVFVTATKDTFSLIESLAHQSNSKRMLAFWTEISFATLILLPLLLFKYLESVKSFTGGLLCIAIWSFLWDVWAFVVDKKLKVQNAKDANTFTEQGIEMLFKWIGLDLLFVIIMGAIYAIVSSQAKVDELLVSTVLLAISLVGALIDTVILNSSMYIDSLFPKEDHK